MQYCLQTAELGTSSVEPQIAASHDGNHDNAEAPAAAVSRRDHTAPGNLATP